MKAACFDKNKLTYIIKDVEKPKLIKNTDAIVKMLYTTICGTDIHIIKGDVPEVPDGCILGHEGIGIIEELGANVNGFKIGDKVIISCITTCGNCEYCNKNFQSHCVDGGWIFGHLIDGTQAEYLRVPHATNSLHKINDDNEIEKFTLISDIFPTSYEIGVLNGSIKEDDIVTIIGAGPIGLAGMMTALLKKPKKIIMIDLDKSRLDFAKSLGATDIICETGKEAIDSVMKLTDNIGCNVVIEAIGSNATFDIAQNIVAPTGRIAIVGVFGEPVKFNMQDLWIKNITLTTGLVNAYSSKNLIKMIDNGELVVDKLFSHNFNFNNFLEAFDVFKNAKDNKALKVLIKF
ncbi:alcohol dehydrogenase catalytic domain-containing protein [Spiroplasma turonicum]|uniref:Alcohol dehydrogenase n=1 Tax=Spiroplasma turonicum TaxID=216946 RepID=A0A0K1P6M6_9MOLU|nr:alcohol dehydrogenase catalytic domain-containing protein [Spiroplasma turonicum]AKU79935.1 Alcohol dehydrogenase [Spiroplasma turonicum]ALX70948.1 alcohol dehydrogenase [Spiroplasma turonicum]